MQYGTTLNFSFYSNEANEPVHIHISKGDGVAKYWLDPDVIEEYSYGFKVKERRDVKILVNEHSKFLRDKWHEYFS